MSSVISTTLNFSLYTYGSGTRNVSLFYNCDTERITDLGFYIVTEKCSNNDANVTIFMGALADTSTEVLVDELYSQGLCERKILVPVSERAALALQSRSTTFGDAINEDFELALRIEKGPCISCESSGGNCGTNFTDGRFVCFCKDGPYAATRCRSEPSGSRTLPAGTVTGISAGVAGTIIVAVCALYISRKKIVFFKKFTVDKFDIEEYITDNGSLTPKRYSYLKVKRMTNTFNDVIGKGAYGTVYKGVLPDGLVVAVKVLSGLKGDREDFINEVASIGRTSHVNIVTLLGFCYERDKRALIYEYMPNGSLDKFIHNQESVCENFRLEWTILSEIAVGVARGLEYLHRGCNTRILHFDTKPQYSFG